MLYTHEFRGISYCRPWPAREKQHLVLQLVSNEQDSCAILNLTIRVVGWIEGFLDTRFLIWHHYEDVIQLIHLHYIGLTMSVTLLREGGKYYRKCKLFKSFRDVYLRLSQKIDPLLNLLGNMNLQTPCWKNWNSFDRHAGCFNFSFSSGCYKTVYKLTNEQNILKYRSEFAFFFCVQIKGGQSF